MADFTDTLHFDEPQGLAPRGTLVVIPGRGEHPDVYRRFGLRLAFDAYRVRVVDDPTLDAGHTHRQVERSADAAGAAAPVVLVGSDTGALFAAGLVADGELDAVRGLVLAGLPAARSTAPGDAARSWDDELDARTTCPTHRQRIADSLVAPGALYEPVPDGWLERAAFDAIERPILGLHGRDDAITPLEAVHDLYAAARAAELFAIAEARHDVLNNKSHRTVAAILVMWLERLRTGHGLESIAREQLLGAEIA